MTSVLEGKNGFARGSARRRGAYDRELALAAGSLRGDHVGQRRIVVGAQHPHHNPGVGHKQHYVLSESEAFEGGGCAKTDPT